MTDIEIDARVYHWLSDYAAMIEFALLTPSSVPEADEAAARRAKEVRAYLAQWRMLPPASSQAPGTDKPA